MKLLDLLQLHLGNVLKTTHTENAMSGVVGGCNVTYEQAMMLTRDFGWVEVNMNPFDIIDKTEKFIKSLKRNINSDDIWEKAEILFENKKANTYGKTFDRILISYPRWFSFTVIYGMENNGAPYVVYETGKAVPVAKLRNVKQLAQFIENYER